MKIFWSIAYPENASFVCYPFGEITAIPIGQKVKELPLATAPIKILNRTFLPSKETWITNIQKTIQKIELAHLLKAVLARCCSFTCVTLPDPFAITASLLEKAKNSIVFCLADEKMAFLGATPELLFSRKNRTVVTEAVAGTLPRGKTEVEDQMLENELLHCPKANSEILPVIHFIQKQLAPLCLKPPTVSPIQVKKTPNVQHLYAQIQGTLKKTVTDEDIVKALHPTPALCGLPTLEAKNWIREHEPFKRGLYGGILGWQTPSESCFAVCIRSCLIQGTNVKLFTGAGIVAASNPLDEWEELNAKMKLYEEIFV